MSRLRNVVVTLCGSLGVAIVGYVLLFVVAPSAVACCNGDSACSNTCLDTLPDGEDCPAHEPEGVGSCNQAGTHADKACDTCDCKFVKKQSGGGACHCRS